MRNFDNDNCEKLLRIPSVGNAVLAIIVSEPRLRSIHVIDQLSLKSLKSDGDALLVTWGDGLTHRLTWGTLRDACPCATCRQKRLEPAPPLKILAPGEAGPVRVTGMVPVGNYAYQIDFSDGHKTGIYSLELLREIGEAKGT
jgi:DUF971 family protein